jgi:hypothetical protein
MFQKEDQKDNTTRNQQETDYLCRSEQIEKMRIVSAEKFIQKTQTAVDQQIKAHRNSAPRVFEQIVEKEKEQDHFREGEKDNGLP